MKIGRTPGVTRRPVEYILIGIVFVLIISLVWSSYALKQAERSNQSNAVKGASVSDKLHQIGTVTEADSVGEYRIASKFVRLQSKTFDDSAKLLDPIVDEYSKQLPTLEPCNSLVDNIDATLNSVNDKVNNFYLELDDDIDDSDELRNQYQTEITTWRSTQDANRQSSYDANDIDNQALQSEGYVVDSLVTDRRNKFDQLIADYNTNADQISASRIAAIHSNIDVFIKNFTQAASLAKNYCKDKKSANSIIDTAILNNFAIVGSDLQIALNQVKDYKQLISDDSIKLKSLVKNNLSVFQTKYYQYNLPSIN